MRFHFAADSWLTTQGTIIRYDKLEHCVVYLIGTLVGLYVGQWMDSMAFQIWWRRGLLVFGVLWEVKDGFIGYVKWGWWGGDGFSWRDLVANVIGIILGTFIYLVV